MEQIFDENTFRDVYNSNKDRGFHQETDKGVMFAPQRKQRLLMLVVTEVSEALEAIRINHYADMRKYENDYTDKPLAVNFADTIKNSFEDELADICIRLFDFAGAHGLHYQAVKKEYEREVKDCMDVQIIDVPAHLFIITRTITDAYFTAFCGQKIGEALAKVVILAEQQKIDLIKHIDLKRKYNDTRPHKHGKEF